MDLSDAGVNLRERTSLRYDSQENIDIDSVDLLESDKRRHLIPASVVGSIIRDPTVMFYLKIHLSP